jgi:hypothetical protein
VYKWLGLYACRRLGLYTCKQLGLYYIIKEMDIRSKDYILQLRLFKYS